MQVELSRRADYAVRAMIAIASAGGAWLSADAIAGPMRIPGAFLAKVMADLAHAGLVTSRTGRHGGYVLARSGTAITFLQVINAVDRQPRLRRCVLRGAPCDRSRQCAVHPAIAEGQAAFEGRLGAASLATLVDGGSDGAPRAERRRRTRGASAVGPS